MVAYTPTSWASGDNITSTKLNNMENGIAAIAAIASECPVMVITPDANNDAKLSATYQQIKDALTAGKIVLYMVQYRYDSYTTRFSLGYVSYLVENGYYQVNVTWSSAVPSGANVSPFWRTYDPNDYPTYAGD